MQINKNSLLQQGEFFAFYKPSNIPLTKAQIQFAERERKKKKTNLSSPQITRIIFVRYQSE